MGSILNTPQAEETKRIEKADFNWTLIIAVVVLPLLKIIENHLPVGLAADWPMIETIVFSVLGALGISVVSAKVTGARHKRSSK